MLKIALIGYGEVGRILAEDLRAVGSAISTFDVKQDAPMLGPAMRAHADAQGVKLAANHADAVRRAELVISAVTASHTVAAAAASAAGLAPATFYLDLNSASPGAKAQASAQIARVGGRYVEGAVMTAVPQHRIKVPLLLGGPHAHAIEPLLRELGFAARVASGTLGVASATKMCRSVMIKGLETMLIESLTAARHYGVEDAVLASLRETFPGVDWERQATYFFQRVIEHGRRRSEEMREAAVTVGDAGLPASSAQATAALQAWVAGLSESGVFGPREQPIFARSTDWRVEADRILTNAAVSRKA